MKKITLKELMEKLSSLPADTCILGEFRSEQESAPEESGTDKTLAERGAQYGDFIDHAEITQRIKEAMTQSIKWFDMADDQKEALEMIAHKMGRIVNGDPDYIDSWTDIIGFARLVEKRLKDEQA